MKPAEHYADINGGISIEFVREIQLDAGGRVDDGDAITRVWLLSVGFKKDGAFFRLQNMNLFYHLKHTCTEADTEIGLEKKRDVRDLARLLRVKLKE